MEQIFLLPGDYAVVKKPTQIGTLLGSCVSICLSNPTRSIAAMNHFMLPTADPDSEIGKFGDTSTEKIISEVLALDPDPRNYTAALYGGAAVLGHLGVDGGEIGGRNSQMARKILSDHGIRIETEDVGGRRGRRIDFFTDRNRVDCRLIVASNTKSASSPTPADVRVLIVDDSAVVRKVLRLAVDGVDGIEVVGEAANPFEARELILELNPNVITLDIEMPEMDGLTFLRRLMASFPKPVIIVSSRAKHGTATYIEALDSGAYEVLDKEKLELFRGVDKVRQLVVPLLRRAALTEPVSKRWTKPVALR
jgi:two-component system chemotaxis response regulator CheB